MRIATTAIAAASALLFAVSQVQAAPSMNLQDGVQSPAGMVDLVRKGGGGGGRGISGGRGGGKGFSGRGGGKGFSSRGFSGKSFRGGRGYSGRGYRGRSFTGTNLRGYSGRNYRGGRGYAYRGRSYGNYGKYKNRYYRRSYPFFWSGLAVSGAYYGSNCGWLYRQAQATGSAYWWNRYQDCVYAY